MSDPFPALTERFRNRCAEDLRTLRTLVANAGPDKDIHQVVHAIAGAAGVFGFQDLGRVAAEIDDVMARGEAPSLAALARLDDRLAVVARR